MKEYTKGFLTGSAIVMLIEIITRIVRATALATHCAAYSAYGTTFGLLYTPDLSSKLGKNGKEVSIVMRLDTGADISLVPRMVADELGVDLKSGVPVEITSLDGKSTAYIHRLNFTFGEIAIHDLPVAISEKDTMPFLLGCLGVLDSTSVSLSRVDVNTCFST